MQRLSALSRSRSMHVSRPLLTMSALLMLCSPLPPARAASVLTQHYDNGRSGANLAETTLTTSNVTVAQFGKLFSRSVDGEIYAQPLYVPGVAIPAKGTHNVVYVVTMHNSAYAFDADDPNQSTPLWQVNFGPTVPAVDVQCCCTDISTEIGILSTPVIDSGTNTIYMLSRNKNPDATYHQKLHALDITTGAEKFGGPVEITASGFDPKIENQRPALLLQGGVIYVAWASHNDCGAYHGFIIGYNASTLAQTAVFNVTPSGSQAGIWQGGQGPTVDANGNIYVMTGNGTFDGVSNFGESFLKLNAGLSITDWFTPFNVSNLNAADADLGSSGVLALPGTTRIVGGGKEGKLYLIDTGAMGHFTSGSDNIVQSFPATLGHIHGSPIYWNSPVNGPTVYVWSEQDHLKAFKYTGGLFQTTPISQSPMAVPNGMPGGMLSISANGGTAGTGIVWATHPVSQDANHASVPGIMRAFDASDLTHEIWNSYQNQARDDFGNGSKFAAPTVVNGKVYVPTFSNQLCVYGIIPTGTIPPIPTNLVATAGSAQITLSWTASTGATSYNVKRSTVSGSGYATIASPATNSYTNTGLVNGTTYYYVVSAVNSAGESANSSQASAAPVTFTSLAIDAGGAAAGAFIADADFSGGQTAANYTGAIDTTAVTNPAPQAVYQTERYGNFTYTIPGLNSGASYKVRLHFSEDYWSATGQRVENVILNGTQVLTNYDIMVAAGAQHKANIQEFTTTGNGSGQVVVQFVPTTGSPDQNAKVDGIEVIAITSVPAVPTGLTATPGNAQATLSWTGSSGATSYNIKRSTVNGSGYATVATSTTASYVCTGLTNGTTYYFVVSAVNAAGESANSAQATATPVPPGTTYIAAGTATIDGVVEPAWNNATAYALTKTSGTISSSADCSATWKGLWDSTNLYLLVDVTDDVKVNDSVNAWDDDSVEIYLDADHNGGTTYDANDRQVVCGWNDASPVEGAGRAIAGVAFAKADPTGTSYRIEAKIPWSVEAFTPATNAVIGIDFHVNDDDDGGARDGKLMWNDGTDQAWTNPSLFGSATLQGGVTPPGAPTGLTATPGNTQVGLSWNASSGATSYNVSRSTVSGSGYASVVTGIATTSYTNTGLANGTAYYFVVSATNAAGTSANSSQASATPAGVPAAPTGLTATPGNTQAALSWAASSGATGYNVSRSTVSGSGYASVATGIATTSYTNTGLANGTAYYFEVSATNAAGTSANSSQASATPYAVAITNTATAPTIDGNVDTAWNSATAYAITKVIAGTAPTSADCSGSFKCLWDSTNLYVLFQVTDDVKVNDSTNPWDDDAVEVFIDGNYSHGTVYDNVDDVQYTFGWGDTVFTTSGITGHNAGIVFAKADPSGTTYNVEIKIPWSTIGGTASAGRIIGFDGHIDDDDDGGARDCALAYSDPNNSAWSNPSVFAVARLN